MVFLWELTVLKEIEEFIGRLADTSFVYLDFLENLFNLAVGFIVEVILGFLGLRGMIVSGVFTGFDLIWVFVQGAEVNVLTVWFFKWNSFFLVDMIMKS